ncbi:hypothetical protein M409DRAFT_52702 [Zasmidium cellare ATCC 36951]|uniref:Zn(2)-C6 fungal-type domain-containing protein n=1 Tax=Zasmidium cellare ATCC 36951 TaxID=1080233 RepID=A0A6A6CQU7_ZASCE|nr:uncharacterized protein M409DRAFT_52702 [Zasmidium cellare ATCC 36951]KAF2169465.1 hypothetical protein M409DRAFT_52702 [Zasmidium cellare ATCC 36951]
MCCENGRNNRLWKPSKQYNQKSQHYRMLDMSGRCVRRKKCDERPHECSTCLSLRLAYAGYGPKPSWMDGGPLEKQKAEEIKAEVNSQRRRGRRRRRLLRASASDNHALNHRTDVDEDQSNNVWNSGAGQALENPAADHTNGTLLDTRRNRLLNSAPHEAVLSSGVADLPTSDIFSTSPQDLEFYSDDHSLASLSFDFGPAPLPNRVSPLLELNGLLDPALFADPVPQTVLGIETAY